MPQKQNPVLTDLPPNVETADTKYNYAKAVSYKQLTELGLDYNSGWPGALTFYFTERFGWCITTLAISGGNPPRTYGIAIKGDSIVTIGRGPHVKKIVEVQLSTDNLERLTPYLKLWLKGMAEAGAIRDRISSRRAEGSLRRSQGQTSWRWDN